MSSKIAEYRLPDYLACYLINGDAEDITEQEKQEIDDFLETEKVSILEIDDDSSFYWSNDLNNIGANCSTYRGFYIN